jgi:signal transduction histidine kinase
MARLPRPWGSLHPAMRYAAAVIIPVVVTFTVAWLGLPAFVFEHLIILIVVAIAIPWGLGPAIAAAAASVVSDDLLLREPIGRPTITGPRDVFDLLLFAAIAVIISALVRRANAARVVAEQAAERERRAREDRDRVVATVTHDLATPLSVLATAVQLVKRQPSGEQDLSALLGPIERASARATSLLRTLADAEALDAPDGGRPLAPNDLRTLVAPIVEMMDRYSERHPLRLAQPDHPLPVLADGDRLQRVVENLLNNAIKYSPGGGPVEVTVSLERREAVLRVRDHGIGVPPEALPRIFEPSFRAAGAAACAPGRGLGLSISRQIVARHGGSIEAAPAEDGGTVVTVRLPLATHQPGGDGRLVGQQPVSA